MALSLAFYAISSRDVASSGVMAPQDYAARYRTTSDIIWSCLTTIFLCTWVSLHLDVPKPLDMKGFGQWKRFKTRVRRVIKDRLLFFVAALLAPEYILGMSLHEFIEARDMAKAHKLSLNQAFFIKMGGFRQFKRASDAVGANTTPNNELKTVESVESPLLLTEDDETPCKRLDKDQVMYLVDKRILRMPHPNEIQDKSKGDWIAKLLVIFQTVWFIIQCIGRKAQYLPLTELEVITVAYTVVNVAIYAVWWEKPYLVTEPVRFYGELPEYNVIWEHKEMKSKRIDASDRVLRSLLGDDVSSSMAFITLVVTGAAFGAIHFIAWSSFFPTPVERLLWRTSSIILTAGPAVAILVGAMISKADGVLFHLSNFASMSLTLISPLIYAVFRVISLVLAFTTLRRLSPEVYQNLEWSDFLPHI